MFIFAFPFLIQHLLFLLTVLMSLWNGLVLTHCEHVYPLSNVSQILSQNVYKAQLRAAYFYRIF